MPNALYDAIGTKYGTTRRADPRLMRQIVAHLGDGQRVVNVGAGTGNYEPHDRHVIAVEPSSVMIQQRPQNRAPAVKASAEALPFATGSFDAAIAISTVHQWTYVARGLQEMTRVAPRQIIYLSEPVRLGDYWLTDEYFPEIIDMATNRNALCANEIAELLGATARVHTFEVPADFTDGAGAFWCRPEAYCDDQIQESLSMFSLLTPRARVRGTAKLRRDLESGSWDKRHGELRARATFDMGYRIVEAWASGEREPGQ